MLSQQLLNELKQIWSDEFQVVLSDSDSSALGTALVGYGELTFALNNKGERQEQTDRGDETLNKFPSR